MKNIPSATWLKKKIFCFLNKEVVAVNNICAQREWFEPQFKKFYH